MKGHKSSNKKNKIIFVVGPTAIGKSRIAVSLAQKINAEIISCDSMQVYRGMGIITSRPSAILRKTVKHHLVSVIAPVKEYNVAQYRLNALEKIKEISRRKKIPLFVGGTGLYMSILIDGIFGPGREDKDIRKRLYQEAGQEGGAYLHQKLQAVDPEAAAKIHPNDTRRIVRALEVFKRSGRPISQLQRERRGLTDEYKVRIFCLDMERDQLYRRIDSRVEKMFKQGLLAQVKRLLKLKLSKTAACAIAVKELKGYFAGLYDLDEAKRLTKKNTRNYAKRQLTWFRKDKRIEWIRIDDKETPASVANIIVKKLKA